MKAFRFFAFFILVLLLSANVLCASDGAFEKIIFLGDSTTAHLANTGLIDSDRIWVPESKTLAVFNLRTASIFCPRTGKNMSIPDAVSSVKPETMIITLGVNRRYGGKNDRESFDYYYGWLISEIKSRSPETKIVLQSVFPVAENYCATSISNSDIDTANVWVRGLCGRFSLSYLDTQSVLRDGGGYLKNEYQNGDGMHLNKLGYQAVLEYIKKELLL